MKIEIVPDEYGACPKCGAYWGHPDPALDFPNRQKVDDSWRCYNPACDVAYFVPGTGMDQVEYELPPEEKAASRARIQAEVAKMMEGMAWVSSESGPGIQTFRLEPEKDDD